MAYTTRRFGAPKRKGSAANRALRKSIATSARGWRSLLKSATATKGVFRKRSAPAQRRAVVARSRADAVGNNAGHVWV